MTQGQVNNRLLAGNKSSRARRFRLIRHRYGYQRTAKVAPAGDLNQKFRSRAKEKCVKAFFKIYDLNCCYPMNAWVNSYSFYSGIKKAVSVVLAALLRCGVC